MSRSVSLPLDASVSAAGEAQFSSRLLQRYCAVFPLARSRGFLAAGYLRAVDPIALFAQRVFCMFGLRRAERLAWEFRVGWRQWFEDKVCTMARDRTLEGIDVVLGFYADMGYLLLPNPKEELYSRLMCALREDSVFLAEMADLQRLPIGRLALQRRLLALDAGVERHMADLAHEMVMAPTVFEGVASGGVQ